MVGNMRQVRPPKRFLTSVGQDFPDGGRASSLIAAMTMNTYFEKSPGYLGFQPLRIPSGWCIEWNALYASHSIEAGDFGGSTVFSATNRGMRFNVDVAFRPEFDPNGHFELTVTYQPWPRNERGRRRRDIAFAFDANAKIVHSSQIQSFAALVEQLEIWIARCSVWVKEGH
jgi:hypothetical protein